MLRLFADLAESTLDGRLRGRGLRAASSFGRHLAFWSQVLLAVVEEESSTRTLFWRKDSSGQRSSHFAITGAC